MTTIARVWLGRTPETPRWTRGAAETKPATPTAATGATTSLEPALPTRYQSMAYTKGLVGTMEREARFGCALEFALLLLNLRDTVFRSLARGSELNNSRKCLLCFMSCVRLHLGAKLTNSAGARGPNLRIKMWCIRSIFHRTLFSSVQ